MTLLYFISVVPVQRNTLNKTVQFYSKYIQLLLIKNINVQ